jgi:multisubunit Na+/H+ antiporter MnhB subunit
MLETITAEQIIGLFTGDGALTTLVNLIAFLAGLALQMYTSAKREGISLKAYWKVHKARSVASVTTLITSFLGLALMTSSPLFVYFTVAYTGDAIVNKQPTLDESLKEGIR